MIRRRPIGADKDSVREDKDIFFSRTIRGDNGKNGWKKGKSPPIMTRTREDLGNQERRKGDRQSRRRLFLSPLGKRAINHVLADQLRSSGFWIRHTRREGLNDDGVIVL